MLRDSRRVRRLEYPCSENLSTATRIDKIFRTRGYSNRETRHEPFANMKLRKISEISLSKKKSHEIAEPNSEISYKISEFLNKFVFNIILLFFSRIAIFSFKKSFLFKNYGRRMRSPTSVDDCHCRFYSDSRRTKISKAKLKQH